MDFKQVILKAKHGDTDAFALLYQEYYTPIFRFVYSKIGDKSEAEDLTQVVFTKLFKAVKNYEDRGFTPLAYIFTMARNELKNFYRKKSAINMEDEDLFIALERTSIKNDRCPISSHEKKSGSELLLTLLKQLKDEPRKILEMKYLSGYSNKEISQTTNKSEANIRQIQVRAIRQLKDYFFTQHSHETN
jgi:RNA polymerase sigma-70 factor (ECF subfamily)